MDPFEKIVVAIFQDTGTFCMWFAYDFRGFETLLSLIHGLPITTVNLKKFFQSQSRNMDLEV
jgi:hypothetical protein